MTATNFPEFNAAVTELTTKVSALLGDVAQMQSVANVQVAVDKAAEASVSATEAAASKAAAASSAASATSSKDSASASATKAGQWAEANEGEAVEAGKYSAKHHAIKAAASASSASASAATATTKAGEASTSAASSASSAGVASSKAGEAAASANTASTKAGEASTSATNAANSAATAATKAGEASTSATNAANANTSAQAAKTAAEAARDRAETAAATVTGNLIEMGGVSLASGVYPAKPANNGAFWKVTAGGTVGGVEYGIGDTLVYSKSLDQFYKIDNTESVTSVAGRTGVVTLTKADVGLNNVDNTSDANKPISAATQIALNAKAPLASPALTGTPTTPTPAAGTNTTQIANTAFVQAALAALVDSSPATLDTLNELAAALGDDPNFATTMTNALALKAPLDSPALTGNPTAPTAAADDNDTSVATTAFVRSAMALFGVGANTPEWPKTTLNDFTVPTGFYRAPSSVTDTPFTDYWGVAIEKAPDGAYVRQSIWCLNGATRIFERVIVNGVAAPWREIWHSGNLVKQTSATDTTAGALMAVGAFGLGRPLSVGNTDLNALQTSGFYRSDAAVNAPTGFGYSPLLVVNGNDTIAQIAVNYGDGQMFVRGAYPEGGVWSAWNRMFSDRNILGTVSQSGGVPTGAIIERGSNANGEYVRFADGTQICSRSVGFPGDGPRETYVEYAWPAVFANTNYTVELNPDSYGYLVTNIKPSAKLDQAISKTLSTNSSSITVSTGGSFTVNVTAIGRWY